MKETLKFSIVGSTPTVLELDADVSGTQDEPVTLKINGTSVVIEPQQLMELGALFLALAGNSVDFDSADELLDGFELRGKEAAQNLANALWED